MKSSEQRALCSSRLVIASTQNGETESEWTNVTSLCVGGSITLPIITAYVMASEDEHGVLINWSDCNNNRVARSLIGWSVGARTIFPMKTDLPTGMVAGSVGEGERQMRSWCVVINRMPIRT